MVVGKKVGLGGEVAVLSLIQDENQEAVKLYRADERERVMSKQPNTPHEIRITMEGGD
jgi:hypothetical protein